MLAIGLALLNGASGIVISSIVVISEKRRLRKSVLSFLLIAFSTSLPELSVAVNSIVIGNMSVSLEKSSFSWADMTISMWKGMRMGLIK